MWIDNRDWYLFVGLNWGASVRSYDIVCLQHYCHLSLSLSLSSLHKINQPSTASHTRSYPCTHTLYFPPSCLPLRGNRGNKGISESGGHTSKQRRGFWFSFRVSGVNHFYDSDMIWLDTGKESLNVLVVVTMQLIFLPHKRAIHKIAQWLQSNYTLKDCVSQNFNHRHSYFFAEPATGMVRSSSLSFSLDTI